MQWWEEVYLEIRVNTTKINISLQIDEPQQQTIRVESTIDINLKFDDKTKYIQGISY